MNEIFSRTESLIGTNNLEKLKKSHIAIFGIGGVGGYVLEGLVRSGVGYIDLFDNDTVSITNINRQIIATNDTIGLDKVEVIKERLLSINKNLKAFTIRKIDIKILFRMTGFAITDITDYFHKTSPFFR